jgi:predicted peptidase
VLVPQAPDWFADEARPKVTDTDLPMLTLLFKLIDEIEKQHPVDPDRIYLTGQSMGGFGVCNAMERNADRFAAAVMVAGSLPEKGKHFAGTPTWLFVGQYDARKAQAEATAAAIRSAGGEPKLTILPDTGHVAWPAAYAMDGVWEWLFSRQKAH